jgi:hypothetical protein
MESSHSSVDRIRMFREEACVVNNLIFFAWLLKHNIIRPIWVIPLFLGEGHTVELAAPETIAIGR